MKRFSTMLYPAILCALCAGFFIWLQFGFPHSFGDPDGYYHAAMAKMLQHGQVLHSFPWMQETTWKDHFADQHFLYHILLIPFSNLVLLPWSIVLFATISFAFLLALLRRLAYLGLWLWLLLFLFGSIDFLFRVSLVKANTLSIALLMGALLLLHAKKFTWLLPLSFVFVWTYGGFVFLPLVVSCFLFTQLMLTRRFQIKPLLYTLCGLLLGLLFHPQAASIWQYLYTQIFVAGLGARGDLAVGVEWEHYTFWNFWQLNTLLGFFYVAAVFLFLNRAKESVKDRIWESFFFLLSLVFLTFALKSRRFIEYFLPFAILFEAATLSPYFAKLTWQTFVQALERYWQVTIGVAVVAVLLTANAVQVSKAVAGYLRAGTSATEYRGAAQWLLVHSQPGAVVFNTRWDQFPQLFYWDHKNYYIVGLDPTFMFVQDPTKYRLWKKISDDDLKGMDTAELRHIFADEFRAKFVFLDTTHNPRLQGLLSATEGVSLVYSDPKVLLYRLGD